MADHRMGRADEGPPGTIQPRQRADVVLSVQEGIMAPSRLRVSRRAGDEKGSPTHKA